MSGSAACVRLNPMRLVTRIGWVLLFALPHPAGAGPLVATSGSQAAEAQPLATSAPAVANVVPLSSPAQTTALANALKQLHSGQAENAAKELQKIRALAAELSVPGNGGLP